MRSAALALALAMIFHTASAAAEELPGAAHYRRMSCAACHGKDGSASTPAGKTLKARDLRSAAVQSRSDEELAATISDGRGRMPSFKASLSPQHILEVVAYIRTLATKENPPKEQTR